MMSAFALKIKHGIDHMFQNAGTGNGALFGNMSDQKQRKSFFLGQFYQLISAGAHLGDRAGGRFDFFEIHGLNGVDNNYRGRRFFQRGDNIFNFGGAGQIYRRLFKL